MSKEIREVGQVPEALRAALEALPDPGVGKKLIVVIRASSVRLHVVDDESTIQGQDGKSEGGSEVAPS